MYIYVLHCMCEAPTVSPNYRMSNTLGLRAESSYGGGIQPIRYRPSTPHCLGSTASTQTKVSTLVALHHHLLQQCHLSCNTLPEGEHNRTSHLTNNDSAYAPNTPGSLRSGTTEIHASPLPRSPTGVLDLECLNFGIRDFYSPRCSTCGN